MRRVFLSALNRFNAAHPWSHNDAYARFVIREAHKVRLVGGTRALDVGCGTGTLLARLARVLDDVTGLEPDPTTASLASQTVSGLTNAKVYCAPFPPRSPTQFDFISMVAVLHHMRLGEGLDHLRRLLAANGRLVIVGVYRETRADLPLTALSLVLNPLVGAIRHPNRADYRPQQMTAPVADPDLTFVEIRDAIRAELPGVRIRRCLFWRYVAVWRAPVQ